MNKLCNACHIFQKWNRIWILWLACLFYCFIELRCIEGDLYLLVWIVVWLQEEKREGLEFWILWNCRGAYFQWENPAQVPINNPGLMFKFQKSGETMCRNNVKFWVRNTLTLITAKNQGITKNEESPNTFTTE